MYDYGKYEDEFKKSVEIFNEVFNYFDLLLYGKSVCCLTSEATILNFKLQQVKKYNKLLEDVKSGKMNLNIPFCELLEYFKKLVNFFNSHSCSNIMNENLNAAQEMITYFEEEIKRQNNLLENMSDEKKNGQDCVIMADEKIDEVLSDLVNIVGLKSFKVTDEKKLDLQSNE